MSINLKQNFIGSAYTKHLKIPLIASAVAISSLITSFDLNAEGSANTGSAYNKGTQISKTSANQSRDFSKFLPENYVKGKYTLKLEEAQKWAKKGKGVGVNLRIGGDVGDATDEEVFAEVRKTLVKYKIPSKSFILHRGGGDTLIDFTAEDQTFAGSTLKNYQSALVEAAVTYASAETMRKKVRESSRDDNVKLTANERPEPMP